MKKVLLASILLAGATSCAGMIDSDEDGLTNAEEAELGTDPESADSDGDGLSDFDEIDFGSDPLVGDSDDDGLSDGEEADYGTDPNSNDSDGDGYLDSWEITEGSDPANAGSVIYRCGWTYNPDKDAYDAPNIEDLRRVRVGDKLARFQLLDRCGDTFDIYDVAGQGVPVALDLSAIWCGPCNGIASWISGQGDSYGFGSYYGDVPGAIHDGKVIWVTLLGENSSGGDPTEDQLAQWYADYPEEGSPLIGDNSDVATKDLYVLGGWPTVMLLDENLEFTVLPTQQDFYGALTAIGEL